MKILYLDIDGCVVDASIQDYIGKIELFNPELIKDYEYIKNCIQYKLEEAKRNNSSDVTFVEKVYEYVSVKMFEMLKEYRDCFLECDNLTSRQEKLQYVEDYKKNPVSDSDSKQVPKYMKYIIESLVEAKDLIEKSLKFKTALPFKTINEDNDIVHYTESENPLKRSESALNTMITYAETKDGGDDFLTACRMYIDKEIVNYDEIYTKKHLMDDVVEGLKYLLDHNIYDMIVACSHYTGPREARAKIRLFQEELPFVVMLPESLLKFHTEPAQMNLRRERSSKNDQINIMNKIISCYKGIEVSEIEASLIDDSAPNLVNLSEEKDRILYRKQTMVERLKGLYDVTIANCKRLCNWSIKEINRVYRTDFKNQETEEKRLIKK